jgi:hypothetical protein
VPTVSNQRFQKFKTDLNQIVTPRHAIFELARCLTSELPKAFQDRLSELSRGRALTLTVVTGGTTVRFREKTKKYREMPDEENLDVVSSRFLVAGKRSMVARRD